MGGGGGRAPRGSSGAQAPRGGGAWERARRGAGGGSGERSPAPRGPAGRSPAAGESRARCSPLLSPLCAGRLPSPGTRLLGRGQLPVRPSLGGCRGGGGWGGGKGSWYRFAGPPGSAPPKRGRGARGGQARSGGQPEGGRGFGVRGSAGGRGVGNVSSAVPDGMVSWEGVSLTLGPARVCWGRGGAVFHGGRAGGLGGGCMSPQLLARSLSREVSLLRGSGCS